MQAGVKRFPETRVPNLALSVSMARRVFDFTDAPWWTTSVNDPPFPGRIGTLLAEPDT
jgi:hypothetical protein